MSQPLRWLFAFVRWLRGLFHRQAVCLHLRLETVMPTIGAPVFFALSPTNAAGQPAPVSNIAWAVNGNPIGGPDLFAQFTPAAAGDFTVVITAQSKSGKALTASDTFTVAAAPDLEAVDLGLKVSDGPIGQ